MGQALRGEGTPPSDGLAQAWSGLLHHSAPAAVLALALVDGPSHLLLGPELRLQLGQLLGCCLLRQVVRAALLHGIFGIELSA